MSARLREIIGVVLIGTALTVVMTWPLAIKLGQLGRTDNGDGNLSIWNVAWVARTLIVDLVHVFDANIFYPHASTLAYSENNLGAGILAIPGYWATRNPFTAHNSAVLLGFLLTFIGMHCLVRALTADRGAALVSATCFAFTPFMFAHSAHVQLLMTAGLAWSMFMFHRFADRPSPGRGALLGAAMGLTAIFCGYYGVFVVLMVGFAVLVVATTRHFWTAARYWIGLAVGALTAAAVVGPAFLPYVTLQRVQGFRRALDEARLYSSNWSDYFASAAHAHGFILGYLPRWVEVAFPGFLAVVLGLLGTGTAWKRSKWETLAIYGGLTVLSLWASFGPAGGLYSALYHAVPLFAWLRVPARFALIVLFGVSIFAGFGASALIQRFARQRVATAVLVAVAAAELLVPSNLRETNGFEPVYRTLATLPRAPVIEMPFYVEGMFQLHTKYMLYSTTHWMPLVNGYSDYIPPDFVTAAPTLAAFPSRAALKVLAPLNVRYAVFHMYGYNETNRQEVLTRLAELQSYLRLIYSGDETRLYEITGYPRD